MPADPITLTRQGLYERVWSTPVTELAKEFRISGVALAKICRKLDVPRPPRGYWQQLAAGQKMRKAPLPKAKPGTRTEFVIKKLELEPEPSPVELADPPDPPPQIAVSGNLRGAHAAALALHAVLEKLEPDRDGILYLRASRESCVRVSPGFRRRIVLILDALARGLEARGASVTFRTPADAHRWGAYEIRVDAEEQHLSLRFFEPFHQVRVKPTPEPARAGEEIRLASRTEAQARALGKAHGAGARGVSGAALGRS